MRVDAFAIASKFGQFLLYRLLLVEPRLPRVEQCRPDQHVGEVLIALHVGKRRIAMQRRSNERRGLGMPVEQHVFPRDQYIIENHQRVDFVELVRQWVIFGAGAAGKTGATDEFKIGRAQVANKADGVVAHRLVAPVGDRRLGEGLVGVGRCRLVLRAAYNDASRGFLDNVQQHIWILILRTLGAVALGIGIGRNVERVFLFDALDVPFDVGAELRVDLVEHLSAVV